MRALVASVRHLRGIEACVEERRRAEGWLTCEEAAALLEISDASARGLNVARTIQGVARAAVRYERAGLILNRIRGEDELGKLAIPAELTLLGWVPEDQAVRDAGIAGACLLDLPDDGFFAAVRACLARIGIPAASPAAGPHATGHPLPSALPS